MRLDFPLAGRELNRSARQRALYVLRMVPAAILGIIVFFSLDMGTRGVGAAEGISTVITVIAMIFQGFVVVLVAPTLASGLIAEEKRDRTLGLLMLADMSGLDIYAAKFLSVFVQVETMLLSVLPLLAVASFFGGIDVPAVAISVTLFSGLGCASIALTLMCSTFTSKPREAVTGGIGLLLLGYLGIVLVGIYSSITGGGGGFIMLSMSLFFPSGMATGSWVLVFGALVGVAIVASTVSIVALPHQAYDKPAKQRQRRAPRGRRMRRRGLTPLNDLGLLALACIRPERPSPWMWPVYITAGLGLGTAGLMMCFVTPLVVVGLIVHRIVTAFQEAHTSGRLDDLLVTPLSDHELGKAFFYAHLRDCRHHLPMLAFTFGAPFLWFGFMMSVGVGQFGGFNFGENSTLADVFLVCLVVGHILCGVFCVYAQYLFVVALGAAALTMGEGVRMQTFMGMFVCVVLHILGGFIVAITMMAITEAAGDYLFAYFAVGTALVLVAGLYLGFAWLLRETFINSVLPPRRVQT
jgi:hypothetical protein